MSNKLTGIIYRAYNIVSGKSYIGQTTGSLEIRRSKHLTNAKRFNFKFANALKAYPRECWQWSILIEVEVEKLNEYERFFIADLDTQNNGYNCYSGGSGSQNYDFIVNSTKCSKVYELYHPDFGLISGTRSELINLNPVFQEIHKLVSGRRIHLTGWVLAENKDNYPNLRKKHDRNKAYRFYHVDFGTITLTFNEFCEKYLDKKENKVFIRRLINGSRKQYLGWIMNENKENYVELVSLQYKVPTIYTLTHKEYGTHSLTRAEFVERFGINGFKIYDLARKTRKSHKGWILAKEED